jgi:hypothetical protein
MVIPETATRTIVPEAGAHHAGLAAHPCLAAAVAGAEYHRNRVAAAYLDGR